MLRQRAVEIEVRAREQAARRPAYRSSQLILPKIQQSARHYHEMVKIHRDTTGYGYDYYYPSSKHNKELQTKRVRLTPVPLLAKYSDIDLYDFVIHPLETEYRCHNQACERGVQTTSQACKKRVLYKRRLGSALLTMDSLKTYPEMNRKRLFPEQ